ncbi:MULTISPECIES: adenylate/guanylate cyclase domain-containing protein [Zoogloea]|jgi:class 3 adenylate cyclase|uniref:Adenylate/guanylate cyclase domain-containing protein n=1 Tax=Zoogloea oleivorans TaxID=1552750 RepID=A0A6C2D2K3_9RHOO|nr:MULTISPECIES: adenylate/guanylate cyclase domain-containing protein [Zoogloea]MBT9497527.1 adenylate/guanylate cyclase domain-containing protein [Zoogloea sp.]MDD2667877.1 adenylate/guanylate cyclase domain-containing protein [Zoogloea sp.]MDY0034435.1 adenylate/guanylate cyclase domain-containing protein [Zoogloea oleivorans]TYC59973.1 adenylate/guanylate cyclase domain-containing protein [Zoogloea oleivorans]
MSEPTPPAQECAVLFADLVGSTQLYQRVGDSPAFELVDRSIREMRIAVETKRGRVVKHTGDGLMAVFRDADSAADATLAIHQALKELPATPDQRLAVRIGFHFGAVVASGTDVFGDTVNFAARLAELASPGKAITSAETARRLGPEWRSVLHTLPPRVIRGVTRPVELCELMCEAVGELTIVQSDHFLLETEPELHLYLDANALVLNSSKPSARIGRDPAADMVIADTQSSRRHAEVELRGDKFVLIDRSSNGTFVQIDGEREFLLSREEVVLRGRGHFSLGRSCSNSPQVISFVCI